MSKSETRVVSGTYDNVFRAVCDAARAEAMTVTSADPAAGPESTSSDTQNPPLRVEAGDLAFGREA